MDRRIQQLEVRVEKLERELNRSSRNSSAPPSSDPPSKRRQPRSKDASGRKQGAQDGHEGHGRELLPASAVNEVIEHWPERCDCGHEFAPQERVSAGEPQRHQVEELPVISTVVVEHRAQRVRCPGCGKCARAQLPERLQAARSGRALKRLSRCSRPQPCQPPRRGGAGRRVVWCAYQRRRGQRDPDAHSCRAGGSIRAACWSLCARARA